jgi:murein L,D-transpeptidase YafK
MLVYASAVLIAILAVYGCIITEPIQTSRVGEARGMKGTHVKSLVNRSGLRYPPKSLYFRAFKQEAKLEIWGANSSKEPHKHIKTYSIAAMSGNAGPKRKQGDLQVPEGFYAINRFNPESNFHLSLGLNYPNKSDRILSDKNHPGGDIFIHGNEVSAGCLAMTDEMIEEIYLLALDARSVGARNIPVHIFPCRMDDRTLKSLRRQHTNRHLHAFWDSLKPAYDQFNRTGNVPVAKVLSNGRYLITPAQPSA